MNSKFKPASRLSIVFILAVVISGSVLTWFSINSISNLKELTEKRILEEQRELSARFSSTIQSQIEKITVGFKDGTNPAGFPMDSLINTSKAHGFITLPFILNNNVTFIFPNFKGIHENPIIPKFSNQFKTAYSKGEQAEFSTKKLKTAKKLYLLCLSYSKKSNDSVKALNALGRISVKLNNFENAISHYGLIITRYSKTENEDGLPYVYFAIPQLIKITNSDNYKKILPSIENCLVEMGSGSIPLNFNTKELLNLTTNWIQENTFKSPGKLAHINKLAGNIYQQLQFINAYKNELFDFVNEGELDNHLNVGNDFKVVNSFSMKNRQLLLININLNNPVGFLIDGNKLFDSIQETDLQSDFEFDYKIEFINGYDSNTKGHELIYTSQLNPYFQGLQVQIKLYDENLIKNFIKRRSWIYGIASMLLLVAMLLGVALIIRDIRREKRLARLRSDFISNVTHELKTPLTSILMFAESLSLGRLKSESDKKEYYSLIIKESGRLKRMINNILEFSKMEKGKSEYHMVATNLSEVIKSVIHEMNYWLEEKNFEVKTELNSTIIIEIDPEKIKQALENLISNAVKYSNENRKIIIRLFSDKKNICLEVEDFGIGIPEDQQNHIFEKFFRVGQSETRNISGTGLGLTVVKEIVEAHDGQIKVSGNIGIGSKFSIFLKTSNKQ